METIPTIGEMMAAYVEAAKIERAKNDQPSVRTVTNVLTGVRHICRVCGVGEDVPISALTRRKLDEYVAGTEERGHALLTAWTYLRHLQALVARWVRPYYADRGWSIPSLEFPCCRKRFARYERPARETLAAVKAWYESLWWREDKRYWLAATLMLELGMRNGDVGRLRSAQFQCRQVAGGEGELVPCLCYQPRKTAHSSGRRVNWPIAAPLWRQISLARGVIKGDLVVPCARQVFRRLNSELRRLKLFPGSKACYELRKICVDHVYQRFGAERASSISGDDIRTVTRYYADPSVAVAIDLRVVDMM